MRNRITFLAVALAVSVAAAPAQIPGLGDLKDAAMGSLADKILKKGPAITTSLKDAKWDASDPAGFTSDSFKRLTELQRTPNGGFVLQPGAWMAQLQSY